MCDGVSTSMFEILHFLKSKGHKVSILNFLTNEPYKKLIFETSLNNKNSINIVKKKNICKATFKGIEILHAMLPDRQNEIHKNPQKSLKIIYEETKKQKIDFALTLEENILTLTAASLLGIPSTHFFHSLFFVKPFPQDPVSRRLLQRGTVFSTSKFIQTKVTELLNLNSVIWHPIIDFNRYRTSTDKKTKRGIGFYSGETKGNKIINKIIEKMPHLQFHVVGRYYKNHFRKNSPNLTYYGDITDIKRFYQSIKILLVPSINDEAFARVILEAAASGIPTIANNIGGIPEALGDSGILVNTKDLNINKNSDLEKIVDNYIIQINNLINNSNKYCFHSKKALDRVKKYTNQQQLRQNHIYDKYLIKQWNQPVPVPDVHTQSGESPESQP